MSTEPNFQDLVKSWLAKTKLQKVVWYYKDGTVYPMSAEEFVRWLQSKLVEGMFGSHREIIKRMLIENEED